MRCVALLLLPTASCLTVFTPAAFVIRRQVGQLGFATETEWDYFGGERNPLDPNQPQRTVESQPMVVRLFDAQLIDGRRVLLKEFIGGTREIGQNELDVYSYLLSGGSGSGGGSGGGGGAAAASTVTIARIAAGAAVGHEVVVQVLEYVFAADHAKSLDALHHRGAHCRQPFT